jgi:hypothetical protein
VTLLERMKKMENYILELDKILNRFIFQTKKFIVYSAFPYALADLSRQGRTNGYYSDFEYFALTKSLKTLISIKRLLKIDNNEDVFILVRSIFENYLSCRFFNENYNKEEQINGFIVNPINIFIANFNVREGGGVFDRQGNIVGAIENPSSYKMGMDKRYYPDFYSFLNAFAHCNFGVFECYMDEDYNYRFDKVNYPILSRLFAVFVFTKLFELIVTVKGEDFKDERSEKACYDLLNDSLGLLNNVFKYMIVEFSISNREILKHFNKRMKELLKKMKKSLNEELGSVIKEESNVT